MKLKLAAIFFSFCVFSTLSSQAQIPGVSKVTKQLPKAELGLKLGANFETLSGSSWQNTYKPGIVGGVFVGLHKGSYGIRIEGLINSSHYTSQSFIDSTHKGDFRATYFDFPILFEYKVIPRVWLQIGPQYSNVLSIKSLNDFAGDSKSMFKSNVFALIFGIEAKLPMHITVGARYILGLTDMNNVSTNNTTIKNVNGSWSNRSAQVSLGFRFL